MMNIVKAHLFNMLPNEGMKKESDKQFVSADFKL